MYFSLKIFTLPLLFLPLVFSDTPLLLTDNFLQTLKHKATTWAPRRNFPIDTPIEQLQNLASLKGIHPNSSFTFPLVNRRRNLAKVETTFDSRSRWPNCSSITSIRYQGRCGGCWAFAAVEVMSDRLCIVTNGTQNVVFSVEELISCCSECGFGCHGGYLLTPYEYWVEHGIPSGGDQDSGIGCKPFTARDTGVTPLCTRSCVNGQNYTEDLRYGITAYRVNTTVEEIQQEISTNGAVGTFFYVYEDFYSYGSGIYQYTSGNQVGGHVVKIVGWGEENGTAYWTIANSWGESWGENGFFRIIRGTNDCEIESYIVAGIPSGCDCLIKCPKSVFISILSFIIFTIFRQ